MRPARFSGVDERTPKSGYQSTIRDDGQMSG